MDGRAGSRAGPATCVRTRWISSPHALDWNPLQLESELEKLETAFGTRHPDQRQDDMRLLVPQTREGGIFDLSDAIRETRSCRLPWRHSTSYSPRRTRHRHPLRRHRPHRAQSPSRRRILLSRHTCPRLRSRNFLREPSNAFPRKRPPIFPRKKDGTLSTYLLGIAAINAAHYTLAELGGRISRPVRRQISNS